MNTGTTRCIACLLLGLFVTSAYTATGQEPRLEWAFETKGKIYASPILADLDRDGVPEVIVAASRDKRVLCLDGQGELLWDYRIDDGHGDGVHATPSAVDYDRDGFPEVFFLTASGTLGCLDRHGRLIWRAFTGDRVDYSAPLAADLTGDGHIELAFGSESGTFYCYDDAGRELWHYQGFGDIRGIPAAAFHEPSGTRRLFATFGGGMAACLDSAGKVVWSHDEPTERKERRSGPAVGDVDGDGELEVVLATEDFQVIVREAFTGTEEWRWKGRCKIDQTHSFALADFDGTGRLDIVCGDGTGLGGPGHVYRLRDGNALWSADVGGGVLQGPAVGDVDGDGDLEILVCSRSRRLICLSPDGVEEWSYPSNAGSLTTPALGDIDGDGKVEVVFTSKDRFVYCVTVDGNYAPERMPWPMMNQNSQLTGTAGEEPFGRETAPPSPTPAVTDLRIDRFEPLRTGNNVVSFTFGNDSSRPRHLEAVAEVTRPQGGVVSETVSLRLEGHEERTARFEIETLDPGRYELKVQLLDVGAGRVLADRTRSAVLEPFAWERGEAERLARDIKRLLDRMPGEALVERANAPLARSDFGSVTRHLEALARAMKPDGTFEGGPRAMREGLVGVNGALRDGRRFRARLCAAAVTPGDHLDFAVAPETTLKKVFRDEPYLGEAKAARPCELALAGNEAEGIQVVVVPLWRDLANLRVSVGDLVHAEGHSSIPSANISVRRVGYIEIGPPEYNWFVEKRGYYPDVLFPEASVDVPADRDAQPFFITVRAEADTPPGTYTGVVRVEADGCTAVELPLSVRVWDFALSEETHLKTTMWMNEGYIRRFYQYEDETPPDVLRRFYDLHLSHRVGPVKGFPLNDGEMLDDFEYLIANGQNNFFIAVPEYLAPDQREGYAENLRSTHALLEEKGWNDLALFYTRDEVAVMARHMIPKVVEMNHWIHEVIPDWPRLQTSAPEQSLFGAVDVWCPTINNFDPAVLAERMAKGDRLWFYTVWGRPGIMIEFPATDHRLMFWECWKYNAEGFLYWGTTHWDLNMTTDQRWPDIPWVSYNRQPGHNGCGYLIYPGPGGTPLASIRLELVRDGIEDYEYLYLLRELLTKAGDRAPDTLRTEAEAELAIAPEVLRDHKDFTEDPEAILSARARIAGLIEKLRGIAGE